MYYADDEPLKTFDRSQHNMNATPFPRSRGLLADLANELDAAIYIAEQEELPCHVTLSEWKRILAKAEREIEARDAI